MDDQNRFRPNNYEEYLHNFNGNNETLRERRSRKAKHMRKRSYRAGRKGLKWVILGFFRKPLNIIVLLAVVVLAVVVICVVSASNKNAPTGYTGFGTEPVTESTEATTTKNELTDSYQIQGVPLLSQTDLTACCESYACTMVLQYMGIDVTINEFVEDYLIKQPVYYGDDGVMYGPDMDAAFAGDLYTGYGINSPAMAKSINGYMEANNLSFKAHSLKGISVEELCSTYVVNDIPVMIWATAYMTEPYIHQSWVVDYVDENSTLSIGDETGWIWNEHCMVLTGYDDENYYLSDSVAGKVSAFKKDVFEDRYAQLGSQAVVIK